MDASGEHSPVTLLLTTVVHSDLGVRYTTVEAGFRIRLVLLISVTTRGSSSHFVNQLLITNKRSAASFNQPTILLSKK